MFIISGASGQVGSAVIDFLLEYDIPIRGVIRNEKNRDELEDRGVDAGIADLFDLPALKEVFKGGETALLMTPENSSSKDVIEDAREIISNYREAIKGTQIKKIVGLSSIGAQHKSGTGNLEMSYMLENAFKDMSAAQTFVRPAYYYSNWLLYMSAVKEEGILHTFFPVDLKIPMVSPIEVSGFISEVMIRNGDKDKIFELVGPESYSPSDVAELMGETLGKTVKAEQMPRDGWNPMLLQAGYSENAAANLIKMIDAVIDGKTVPGKKGSTVVQLDTTLGDYLRSRLSD